MELYGLSMCESGCGSVGVALWNVCYQLLLLILQSQDIGFVRGRGFESCEGLVCASLPIHSFLEVERL